MKIKLRKKLITQKDNYDNDEMTSLFTGLTFMLGVVVVPWLISAIYKFMTWEPLHSFSIRFTILMLIVVTAYLLIFFKIENNEN